MPGLQHLDHQHRIAGHGARFEWPARAPRETDLPNADIAEELDFSTQGHFTRFFVIHPSLTPTQYRHMSA